MTSGKPLSGTPAAAVLTLPCRATTGPDVPIRILLHGDVFFEPQDIEKLTTAFELALSKLELVDRQDPLAVVLAKLIIELAKEGERDPEKLCDGALAIPPFGARRPLA